MIAPQFAIRTRDGRWVTGTHPANGWAVTRMLLDRGTWPTEAAAREAFDRVFARPRDADTRPVLVPVGHNSRREVAELRDALTKQHTILQFLGPFAEFFERLNAPDTANYLTATLEVRKDERPWVLTAQREGGKTPAERIDEMRKEADAQRARADAAEERVRSYEAGRPAISDDEMARRAAEVRARFDAEAERDRLREQLAGVERDALRFLNERDQARLNEKQAVAVSEHFAAEYATTVRDLDAAKARIAELQRDYDAGDALDQLLKARADVATLTAERDAALARANDFQQALAIERDRGADDRAEHDALRSGLAALRDKAKKQPYLIVAQRALVKALDALLAGNAPAGVPEHCQCDHYVTSEDESWHACPPCERGEHCRRKGCRAPAVVEAAPTPGAGEGGR
jgi:hypothetical protein